MEFSSFIFKENYVFIEEGNPSKNLIVEEELDGIDILLLLIGFTNTSAHLLESERSYEIVTENHFCVHHKYS